jgi:predicted CopG family antitoxin
MTKTVRLNDATYQDLLDLGQFRETMDDIISKCIECYKKERKK